MHTRANRKSVIRKATPIAIVEILAHTRTTCTEAENVTRIANLQLRRVMNLIWVLARAQSYVRVAQ